MNATTEALYAHRRERLRTWMTKQKLTGRAVARMAGWNSAAHVTNLVRGHSAFGEKVARQVEKALLMPDGYLDQDLSDITASSTLPVVEAVLALRDAMGPAFMGVKAHKVDLAVRLVLKDSSLVSSAAALLKN